MPNQYFATNRKVGDGSTTVWEFSFAGARPDANNGTEPYLEPADVGVALVSYDAEGREVRTPVSFTLISPTQVEVTPAIASGQDFVIFRETESELPVSDFTDFASISEQDLDNAIRQTLFAVQELRDDAFDTSELSISANGTALGAEATANQAASDASVAVSTANTALNTANSATATANTALNTANQAASDASSAVTTANNALTVTNSFQDDVDQLQTAVDELLGSGAGTTDLMYKSDNLSGLTDVVQARSNLGVPSTLAVDESINIALSGHVGQADPHTQYLQESNNLSDLANVSSARTNLGLGTAAVQPDTRYAHRENNLSDLASASTARTNLGLGTAATAGTTDSRTSASTTLVLQAKGMNDHRTSGDHDSRYYTQTQVDDRIELVGGYSKRNTNTLLWFQTYKSSVQDMGQGTSNTKITWSTLDQTGPIWYTPAAMYDRGTHEMIAPVTGLYKFWVHLQRATSQSGSFRSFGLSVALGINGTVLSSTGPQWFVDKVGLAGSSNDAVVTVSGTATVMLNAGDRVALYSTGPEVAVNGSSTSRTTYWGAQLV